MIASTTHAASTVRPDSQLCRLLALAFTCACLSLIADDAVAQSALVRSASEPVLVTSHLTEGIVHDRLVPMPPSKARSTTSWVTERRFTAYRGMPAVLQVMKVGAAKHAQTDSLLFDRATLRSIWEHLHGVGMATFLSFDGDHVTGRATRKDSAARVIDLTTVAPAFSTTIDDLVVQSIPLRTGYHGAFPFVGGDGSVQTETIRVKGRERMTSRNGVQDAWAVDLSYPSGSETLWIDPATRAILRHVYTLRNHTRLEVVTGG